MEQLEGRNPVIECLARGKRRVKRVLLDTGARPDPKVDRIFALCAERSVPIERVERQRLDKLAEGRPHNGVIAYAEELPGWTTRALLDDLWASGAEPFLVLADTVQYEHNLGAILRSALGFGVHGLVLPTRRGAPLGPVVQRVAMGAAEEVAIVHEGMHAALKHIRKDGIRVIGADMGGEPLDQVSLVGPLALVMGGEGKGLSPSLRERCDVVVSIPLQGELESLNVSVAAAVLMYEKVRQEAALKVSRATPAS